MSIPEPMDDPWADSGPSDLLPAARSRRGEGKGRGRGDRQDRDDDGGSWTGGFERVPPQDLDAEQSVLGGMLLSKDAIADVLERLRPGDFYQAAIPTCHARPYARAHRHRRFGAAKARMR